MKKINKYIFKMSLKYILINILLLTILISFINLLEISRLLNIQNTNLNSFFKLSLYKIPTIISEILPFAIIISIAFLFRNLITRNELISMRNIGLSIIDIFKPIGLCVFIIGTIILIIINPLSASLEKKFNNLTEKNFSDLYSIKLTNNEMWIKNIANINEKNFINIDSIDLNTMDAKNISILNISDESKNIIFAQNGTIKEKIFELNDIIYFDINTNEYKNQKKLSLEINFDKSNLIDSISNYKLIPFYNYYKHINNLKKFNLHSDEVSLYYISQIFNPFFLVIISFTVMGFSGKFKRNENFFKILFISVLIGFTFFLFKEIVIFFAIKFKMSYILSYLLIFMFPLIIGMNQVFKIEND